MAKIYTVQLGDTVYELEGPDNASPEQLKQAILAQQQAPAQQAPESEEPSYEQRVSKMSEGQKWLEAGKGILDTGATLATGAVGEIGAGLAGLGTLAMGGGVDNAVKVGDKVRGFITHSAWSDAGKYNEQQLAKLGKYVDPALQAVDDGIATLAGERTDPKTGELISANPALATALKTALYGIPSVVGMPGTSVRGLRGMNLPRRAAEARKSAGIIKQSAAKTKADAERLGLILSNDELGDSTVALADALAPDKARAVGARNLQEGLVKAEKAAAAEVDRLYENARGIDAYVKTKKISSLADSLEKELAAKGFDIERSPKLKSALSDMRGIEEGNIPGVVGKPTARDAKMGTRTSTVLEDINQGPVKTKEKYVRETSLRSLDVLSRRVGNAITGDGSKLRPFSAEDRALVTIKKRLERVLDEEFDAAAMSGNPAAHQAWQDARAAAAKYKKQFHRDRTIRRLIAEKEASPEAMASWVIGASANGMSKQAAQTVNRLKEILGPNHPGMTALRGTVIRDTVMPLFGDTPNFKGAVTRIDKLLKENYSTLQALDINPDDLRTLQKAAHAARFVSPLSPKWDKNFFTKFTAKLVFGHQISQAGARMQFAHRVIDQLVGTGVMSEKDILRYFSELDTKRPLVPRDDPSFKEILLYGAAADASNESEHEKEE